MRRLLAVPAALALTLGLAACGTTVPLAQQSSLGGAGGGDGLGGAGTSTGNGGPGIGSTGTGLGSGAASGRATSGTGGSQAGLGSTGGSSTGGSTGLGAGAASGGGVVSKQPIKVGVAFVKDAAAGFQAIGVQGATLGDQQLYAQTLVNDINAHGGLAGRKVVPVFFGYDVNPGSASYQQQDSQACAQFTQDNHVEVAITNFAGDELTACLQRKGIPMLADGPTGGWSAAGLRKTPALYVLGGFNLDRRASELAKALPREKYFSGWDTANGKAGVAPVKVGVITYDVPAYRNAVDGPLVQGLTAAGYQPTQVVYVAAHDSYDDLSKMQPQLSNAVLSFRAAGITHVLIYDDNGVASLFFMQQAENQSYRPRYGVTSGNNMQTLAKLVSARQLNGSIGIGWNPPFDIAEAKSPGSKYDNSARKRCYKLMKDKGVNNGTGFNEVSAMMYCSVFFALKERWSFMKVPTAANLPAALDAYGSSFVDPQVPLTWLSPTQHDGTSGIYDYAYSTGCSCMVYQGGIHPLARG